MLIIARVVVVSLALESDVRCVTCDDTIITVKNYGFNLIIVLTRIILSNIPQRFFNRFRGENNEISVICTFETIKHLTKTDLIS